METKTRKIIKLLAIIVAWILSATVPSKVTIEPPIQMAIKAIILTVPMWIFGRNSSNGLLRIVWGYCDQCLNMVMAFELASSFVGLLGLMLGLMALGAISGIWCVYIFLATIFELIKGEGGEFVTNGEEKLNVLDGEAPNVNNDKENTGRNNESLNNDRSNNDQVIYID